MPSRKRAGINPAPAVGACSRRPSNTGDFQSNDGQKNGLRCQAKVLEDGFTLAPGPPLSAAFADPANRRSPLAGSDPV